MAIPLEKIAIADDEQSVLLLMKEIVQDLGYECVGIAQNGADAVELVRRTQPQVLLLDVHMPVLDGMKVLAQIVEMKTTAVVTLTGDPDIELARRAMDAGASGYMQKPMESMQIAAIVESAWHRFQTIHSLQEEKKALDAALETRKLTEKAKGILMEQQGFSEDDAHKCLLKMSQDQGIPLKEVCRSIIQVKMLLGKKSKRAA